MAKDALEEGHSANLVFGKVSGHPSFLFSRASVLEVTTAQVTSISERGMAQIVCSSVESGKSQSPPYLQPSAFLGMLQTADLVALCRTLHVILPCRMYME